MAEKKNSINELLGISMEKVKEMADVNAIIGDPIKLDDGTTIIPISKVTYGFASGGSDIPSKYDKDLFGGGAGAGISIKPEGFLVISPDGEAKMIDMDAKSDPITSAINSVPKVFEKVSGLMSKRKGSPDESESTADITIND
ncbi:MAG: sporulation protein YtfJ [Ruminococcus sp.]|nr:sporulation protein YtfJ [Ruminococcus sp.]